MPIVPWLQLNQLRSKLLLLALLSVDLILEGLTSLECRNCRSSNLDCSACSRVTTAAKGSLCVLLGKTGLSSDCVDKL